MPNAWLLAGGVIGLVLTIVGWVGRRVDREPRCRSCRHVITEADMAPTCPECGHDLERRRGIRTGLRRRRPLILITGLLMVVGATVRGATRLDQVDWYRYKPVWWLKQDARQYDVKAHAALVVRLEAGRMSVSDIASVVEMVLTLQADGSYPWTDDLGEFIEVARDRGHLADRSYGRYLKQAFEEAFVLSVSEHVERGDPVAIRAQMIRPRLSHRRARSEGADPLFARVAPESPLIAAMETLEIPLCGASEGWLATQEVDVELPPGPHVITLVFSVGIHPEGADAPPDTPIVTWSATEMVTITVPYDRRRR